MNKRILRKPPWLKIQLPQGDNFQAIKKMSEENNLHTICVSGNCPNHAECWKAGTATFMILGDICTRSCRFCNVATGKPLAPDKNEPIKLARIIEKMQLKHAVLTSVDRDDIEDGGAAFWAETIQEIRKLNTGITLETLIPDFQGNQEALDKIVTVHPEVVSHNLETVRRLTKEVRNKAIYDRSLEVLKYLKDSGLVIKSGIMVGLGETHYEISETMDDLVNIGCDVFTIGQYLQPTRTHLDVQKYYTPGEFDEFKKEGLEKGFRIVESGPLVRSSYHAENHLLKP